MRRKKICDNEEKEIFLKYLASAGGCVIMKKEGAAAAQNRRGKGESMDYAVNLRKMPNGENGIEVLSYSGNLAEEQSIDDCLKHSHIPRLLGDYHTHSFIELMYVQKGVFHQVVMGEPIALPEGTLCLQDVNCIHRDLVTEDEVAVFFMWIPLPFFRENRVEGLNAVFPIGAEQQPLKPELGRYALFQPRAGAERPDVVIALMQRECLQRRPGYEKIVAGCMVRLLSELVEQYEIRVVTAERNTRAAALFYEISNYIKDNLDTVNIRMLTDTFHFNRNYFNRLILQRTGLTYRVYLGRLRLERSAELLLESSLSVREIAAAVGYENRTFFNQLFRDRYGLSPGEYRRMRQGK